MISVQQWAKWMHKGHVSIPVLLVEHYKDLQLSDQEMMVLLHIHSFASVGISFPSIEEMGHRMTCSQEELANLLSRLHKERFIDIQSSVDQEGKMMEAYSLEPLWEKLMRYLSAEYEQEAAAAHDTHPVWAVSTGPDSEDRKQLEGDVYKRFELEFGRPLSPIECETIAKWLDEDHYSPQFIFQALKEAVISGKLALKYIDRILFEWEKNGLKTIEDVRAHTKKFRQEQGLKLKTRDQRSPVTFSFYNWLER